MDGLKRLAQIMVGGDRNRDFDLVALWFRPRPCPSCPIRRHAGGKVGSDQAGDAADTFQRVGILPPHSPPAQHP